VPDQLKIEKFFDEQVGAHEFECPELLKYCTTPQRLNWERGRCGPDPSTDHSGNYSESFSLVA